jgi:hypothetical protein
MIERFVAWMDIQDAGERGARPTMWDEEGAGRTKVGIEITYDADGRPVGYLCSSDDDHVMFCQQNVGVEREPN